MLKEKRDLLGQKKEARQAIYDKCVAEKRSRTAEETTQWKTLGDEIKALEEEIRFLEDGERESRQNANIPVQGVHSGVAGNTHSSDGEQRDLAQFSLGRVIRAKMDGERIEGIDAEVLQEGKAEATRRGITTQGNVVIPYEKFAINKEGRDIVKAALERRDMSATGQTTTAGDQGGQTITTTIASLYLALFNQLVLRSMGATFMPNLKGNLAIPRVVKGTSPTWKSENAQADEISPTIASSQLSPQRLPAVIEVSNQLMMQSDENISQVVSNYLVDEISSIFEAASINGAGHGSNMPLGILNTSGIGAVYAGGAAASGTNANGAALVWADVVNLFTKLSVGNANFGTMGYLLNPVTVGFLQQTLVAGNTAAQFILKEGAQTLNAFKVGITNNVPSNLSKGSSTGILSSVIFGNYRDLWIGTWGGLDLLVNPYSKDDQGLTRINAALYADSAVVRPESFAAIKDAKLS
ncbi:phage major capsid protein [Spirosoma sp. BT702]|uniref:Phage major capsid protein n=1 Tax=Spirosoma profusum TaxID=2771354 RepID=A0A927GAQ9_9BACT|nr:phage major capsid protein [Spirosoma profusum]MBD2705608.1 phage major capsid protein [Spirosoma profusum]